MEAIDALANRVSGSVLVDPAPDELELHSILSAAVRAPDHGRLRPWRLIVLRGAARNEDRWLGLCRCRTCSATRYCRDLSVYFSSSTVLGSEW